MNTFISWYSQSLSPTALPSVDLSQVPNHHRRKGKTQYSSSGPWVHVHLRVNLFTFEEWPPQEPASLEDLSIGEEQSVSTVTNLSWSEPGLAKHGRSVLTVLTSNLLLSLWESGSDPGEASSWRRISVINNVLREYFTTSVTSERAVKRMTPIRAAAWTHASNPSRREKYCNILAVTNDHSDVVFLQIRKPYDVRDPCTQKWQVEVLLYLGNQSKSRLQTEPTVELEGIAQPSSNHTDQRKRPTSRRVAGSIQQGIDHDVTWSPWEDVEGIMQAMVTYRNNGWARHFLLHYKHEAMRLEILEQFDENFSDGPVVWISVCDHGDILALAAELTHSRVMAIDKHWYAVHVTPSN